MLDTARIKEAEHNVRVYLAEGLLKKVAPQQPIIRILHQNMLESLRVAINIQELSNLWVIVCSYYAMFYAANATLLALGYKVGTKVAHKVTADALIVYARRRLQTALLHEFETMQQDALPLAGLHADDLIESFEFERKKRSHIQYATTPEDIRAKAQTSLQRAKLFTRELEKIRV